ncbi:hypothetical protein BJ741DRAFT_570281 [Chytriomyces cf. hyalinus JEL632]|nr:hypothetical protein BJ741DRAFT_570281 [Chytriomyces cf. hyalinus JEL632]
MHTIESPAFVCLWENEKLGPCLRTFLDADDLFGHLAEDHIGRKCLGSLQLHCRWSACSHRGKQFGKRDNIVSHCRSHVPFRANMCLDCCSEFKWPQDLKKHCTKFNHRYAEPEFKGRPGPTGLCKVGAAGPPMAVNRLSLTGGRRLQHLKPSSLLPHNPYERAPVKNTSGFKPHKLAIDFLLLPMPLDSTC